MDFHALDMEKSRKRDIRFIIINKYIMKATKKEQNSVPSTMTGQSNSGSVRELNLILCLNESAL